MNDFIKMDMFFVVTTVAVSLSAIAFLVATVYVIRLLKIVEQIAIEARGVARDVHEVSERALDDVRSARDRFAGIFNGISTLFAFPSFKAKATATRRSSGKRTKRAQATKTTNVTE